MTHREVIERGPFRSHRINIQGVFFQTKHGFFPGEVFRTAAGSNSSSPKIPPQSFLWWKTLRKNTILKRINPKKHFKETKNNKDPPKKSFLETHWYLPLPVQFPSNFWNLGFIRKKNISVGPGVRIKSIQVRHNSDEAKIEIFLRKITVKFFWKQKNIKKVFQNGKKNFYGKNDKK